jgi:hypothetical protein
MFVFPRRGGYFSPLGILQRLLNAKNDPLDQLMRVWVVAFAFSKTHINNNPVDAYAIYTTHKEMSSKIFGVV